MRTNDFRSDEEFRGVDVVDGLLTEMGLDCSSDSDELRQALTEVRNLGDGPQPVPSGELAALLTAPQSPRDVVSSLQARRDARRRRLAATAATLSLCLGAGAVAAVASPDFRDSVQKSVSTLLDTLVPPSRYEDPSGPGSGDTPNTGLPTSDTVPASPSVTPPPAVVSGAEENQAAPVNPPAMDGTPALGERGPYVPPAPTAPQRGVPSEAPQPGTVPQEPSQKEAVPPAPAPAPAPGPALEPAPAPGPAPQTAAPRAVRR